jgi:hypothetical protein
VQSFGKDHFDGGASRTSGARAAGDQRRDFRARPAELSQHDAISQS